MLPWCLRTDAKPVALSQSTPLTHFADVTNRAPVSDPCGVAGAYLTPTGGGGETPEGAHQGDRGSKLPPTGIQTTWTAGKTAEVGWMLAANHGGGYSYSLCPKSAPLTEECLNKMPLAFAGANHTVRYLDGRPSLDIAARDVSIGTFPVGSTWRLNPIPPCRWAVSLSHPRSALPTSLPLHSVLVGLPFLSCHSSLGRL